MRIGLISDTHGLLRPQALDALRGSQLILHAGDIGSPDVLDRLSEIAPNRPSVQHSMVVLLPEAISKLCKPPEQGKPASPSPRDYPSTG